MARVVYRNQGAVRSLPLDPQLEATLLAAAEALGIDQVVVVSGGQHSNRPGEGTGSTRHNEGNAADIELVSGGRTLNFANANDRAVFQRFASEAAQRGLTGFGAGADYMGTTRMHVGYGTPAVWGAGGSGANAPGWLRSAVSGHLGGASATQAPRFQWNGAPPAPQPMPTPTNARERVANFITQAPFANRLQENRTAREAGGTPVLDNIRSRQEARSQGRRPILEEMQKRRQARGLTTPLIDSILSKIQPPQQTASAAITPPAPVSSLPPPAPESERVSQPALTEPSMFGPGDWQSTAPAPPFAQPRSSGMFRDPYTTPQFGATSLPPNILAALMGR